jgi:hypothetical protein
MSRSGGAVLARRGWPQASAEARLPLLKIETGISWMAVTSKSLGPKFESLLRHQQIGFRKADIPGEVAGFRDKGLSEIDRIIVDYRNELLEAWEKEKLKRGHG